MTAQEDMDNVLGEMSQQLGNDFSKIQVRFATRMNLTSADVVEVSRRLLAKNEQGIDLLRSCLKSRSCRPNCGKSCGCEYTTTNFAL